MKLSFAKAINRPENAKGNIIFFHPGGLPARGISQIAQSFPAYNFTYIEIRLVSSFINAFSPEGKQLNSLTQIAQEILSEIYDKNDLPSLFLGWSLGGAIAFEAAHLWQGSKKPVLCFLDSTGPHAADYFISKWFGEANFQAFLKTSGKSTLSELDASKWFSYSDKGMNLSFISKYFTMYLNALREVNIPLKPLNHSPISQTDFMTELMEEAIKYGAFDESLSADGFYKVFEAYKEGIIISMVIIISHTYQYYDGTLLLFKADNKDLGDSNEPPYMGWQKLFSKIHPVSVPYDHYAILSSEASEKYLIKEISDLLETI